MVAWREQRWWQSGGQAGKLEVLMLPVPEQDEAPSLLNTGNPQPSETLFQVGSSETLLQVGFTPGAG